MKGLLDKILNRLADTDTRIRENGTGDFYNLASHTEGNALVLPSDGYVFVYNDASHSGMITLKGSSGHTGNDTIAIGGPNQRHSLFVKKGMRVFVSGSFNAARFTPISGGGYCLTLLSLLRGWQHERLDRTRYGLFSERRIEEPCTCRRGNADKKHTVKRWRTVHLYIYRQNRLYICRYFRRIKQSRKYCVCSGYTEKVSVLCKSVHIGTEYYRHSERFICKNKPYCIIPERGCAA